MLEAWDRGDIDAIVALCHPGIRFRSLIAPAEGHKAHRGHRGLREWWAQVEEVFAERRMELSAVEARGEWTMVTGVGHGVGRASGAEVNWPFVCVARLTDGLVSDWRFFNDRAAAEELIGG